jgi:hypothetical protein
MLKRNPDKLLDECLTVSFDTIAEKTASQIKRISAGLCLTDYKKSELKKDCTWCSLFIRWLQFFYSKAACTCS